MVLKSISALSQRVKLGSVLLFLGVALPGSYFLLVPGNRSEEFYEDNGLWVLFAFLVVIGSLMVLIGLILLSIALVHSVRHPYVELEKVDTRMGNRGLLNLCAVIATALLLGALLLLLFAET